ncbi:heme ABC transporter ATP-binding protein [Photobacterium sp. WH77]|uniref:Heme ABC transporter ATP-binding protein n=1 Tax=Photobacterium arenosum TaxID=2774143 RepID=A0ABR9BNU9_9GAMM|nr:MULTISPECIES: heme ABC transporter ATP-binding protein [Photobacterium]MBD8513904.1 heme ABC transporter ATP-binding protein [Photobacterium arenosum]MBV7262454.1 heme ABC transporter ATP-binding protein [Photobacterium sp. WH24]MCG2836344.1 heme ABC transporter ATP-binding protein [Photobacterium sp. WH77]MCG2844029.1 heme ABC transporter ATP-binding protein [Photobacterium sp. WH80]MDO6580455.1 heme ABC transporter ATP-binding protein [Photobacterium sp. 2_MG-2023]
MIHHIICQPKKQAARNLPVAISAEKLSLALGGKVLLDNLSISFRSGELTALLGPNGAGKSTLLKVLSGEMHAKGNIYIFGEHRKNWDAHRLAHHMGVLPQHSTLSFGFTAQEVAELGTMPLKLSLKESQHITRQKMADVGISHLSQRLYPSLSGGEKQRVHFARVLTQLSAAGDQCLLMLDEPTSALDLAHQQTCLSLAKKMADNGAAVILVIHDLNLAAEYADRLILLNHGKIQADGDAWHTLTAEHIQSVYGAPVIIETHPRGHFPVVLSA